MDWVNADESLLVIQRKLVDVELIAYQGVKSIFEPHDVSWYHCITKREKGRNPYHIGTFEKDLSRIVVDCMDREYQLKNRGHWRQIKYPEGAPAYVQWMDWVWKNKHEQLMFNQWLDDKFNSNSIKQATVQPEQLTLF